VGKKNRLGKIKEKKGGGTGGRKKVGLKDLISQKPEHPIEEQQNCWKQNLNAKQIRKKGENREIPGKGKHKPARENKETKD